MDSFMQYAFGGLATVVVALFSWSFNLSARTSVLEQQHRDLKELINEKTGNIITQINLGSVMNGQRLDRLQYAMDLHMRPEHE